VANKSAAPSISAPSAGGAIQGIGEKFSADLQTGTANFTVPINVPAGRNGFQPTLSFQYSSGSGNGPLGLGWALGVPSLSRKTSQKTPIYDDARDTFLLSGAEDLVLIQEAGGVATYRPRTETLFARIEHHRVSGNDHWQVRSGTGFVNDYGTDGNVLADPADPSRIFCWKLTRSVDPFGAQIVYTWDRDAASTQSYLSRIDYLENGGAGSPFLASVEFDYEERPDPFSSYRSGFEIRTTRRCTGLSVFTHATGPTLQRSYRLTYADQLGPAPLNRISLLVRIELTGHDGALTAAMPPADFAYTSFDPAQRKFQKVSGAEMPAESIGQPDMDLVDLFGQGLPDIVQMGVIVRYWRNLGYGQFDVPRIMQNAPTVGLADLGVQVMDANGDSRADLMVQNDRLAGYFPLRSGGHWDAKSFRSFRAAPTFSLKDPEVKLFDLDGDGITDALRTGSRFECFFHDPAQGWSESREYQRRALDLFPNVNFSDPRVRIANLTGDGMQDIVLIHAGGIDYWPNLSYGKFGARIHMRGAPRFPYNYNPKRILIGDVDGDGADDLVYVEDQQVTLWINQSGNQWSEPVVIRGTPPVSDLDALRLVDLLGCGAKGILWSSTADAAGVFTHVFSGFVWRNQALSAAPCGQPHWGTAGD
jgi:Salmonella virulence plasmid 65kDa B protein